LIDQQRDVLKHGSILETKCFFFCNFLREGKEGNLGHIHIHRGRPNWENVFTDLQNEFPMAIDAGVCVCGPKALSRNIKYELAEQNTKSPLQFKLHTENF
jgi:hypothetical protein